MYLTVLSDYPYLVSLLFAVLLSLHLATFLMFFITNLYNKETNFTVTCSLTVRVKLASRKL